MPLPVDSLTQDSPMGAIREAISKSIEICMNEPIPSGYDISESQKPKWCAAKCYSIASEKTGKDLSR